MIQSHSIVIECGYLKTTHNVPKKNKEFRSDNDIKRWRLCYDLINAITKQEQKGQRRYFGNHEKKKRPTPKRLEITYKKDSNFLYQFKEKIGLKGCHK